MKPKHQRLIFIVGMLAVVSIALALMLQQMRDNIVYFYAPSDIAQRMPPAQEFIRAGGLVQEGSVKSTGTQHHFILTDGQATVAVAYEGVLPSLFREGQGIIAEGQMQGGVMVARTILAKHDERYMPPEVAKALKEKNYWKENTTSLSPSP
jgi:cytochrome c-type biogenesis protein CcmE